MSNNIVKVGTALKWRNTYDIDKKYYQENLVTLCGCVFRCKVLQTQGEPPVAIDETTGHMSYDNTDVWDVIIDMAAYYNFTVDYRTLHAVSPDLAQFPANMNMLLEGQKIQDGDIDSLKNAVWPLAVTFELSAKVIEVGKTTNVTATWSAVRNDSDVLEDCEVTWLSPTPSEALPKGTCKRTMTIYPTVESETEMAIEIAYGDTTKRIGGTVKAVHPTYFGVVGAKTDVNEAIIKGLDKYINPSRQMEQRGITLQNRRICLAYPMSFGALTSIRDGNSYDMFSSYTLSEVSVDGIPYYMYLLTIPVTASGVTQIFK